VLVAIVYLRELEAPWLAWGDAARPRTRAT
jgi:hypothetical protein